MFMLDIGTVVASCVGAVGVFGLLRAFWMWRRWSNGQKEQEEIDWDKKIADAIKQGDVEAIAKLRKYFLTYKRSKDAQERESVVQTQYAPGVLYLCRKGRFWFKYDEQGNIETLKPLRCLLTNGKKISMLVLNRFGVDERSHKKVNKKFNNSSDILTWLHANYKLDKGALSR